MNASQLSLYDAQTIGAPHNGTDTSIEAAVAAGREAPARKDAILESLACWREYGQTQDELSIALGLSRQSITGPVNALESEGSIYKTGERRRSRLGGSCAVYRLARTGAEWLKEITE